MQSKMQLDFCFKDFF